MSQENVEVVRVALGVMTQQGLEAFTEYWTDDVEWRAVEGALDDRGPLHGKHACRVYVQDWLDTFDELTVEPRELIDAGTDQVVGVLRLAGRAKLSEIETELTYAVVYQVRDGKIARGREYATREEALEAAGLRE
jgi:ketosteroid isomerase-like protein